MKRYNLKECRGYAEYCSAEMQESPTGEWVKLADLKPLLKKMNKFYDELFDDYQWSLSSNQHLKMIEFKEALKELGVE